MQLIDTHTHLTNHKYDDDRIEVLTRAEQAGLSHIIAIGAGYGLAHNPEAIALAAAHPNIYATVGLHPQDAVLFDDATISQLQLWAQMQKVVAIGECGLDYLYLERANKEKQQAAFAAQCRLAITLDLPVIIHSRDAFADTLAIVKEYQIGKRVEGVIHFFTTSLQEAEAYLAAGLHLGISGVVTLPNAPDLVAAVPKLPLERLLIETDCPYAAPIPHRGRRNEPSYVAYVAKKIAELHGLTPEYVAKITQQNAIKFFRLPSKTNEANGSIG